MYQQYMNEAWAAQYQQQCRSAAALERSLHPHRDAPAGPPMSIGAARRILRATAGLRRLRAQPGGSK